MPPSRSKPSPSSSSSSSSSSQFNVREYISRYDANSETYIQRLLFLARKGESPEYAYRLLEERLKSSGNVKRYNEIFGAPSDESTSGDGHVHGTGINTDVNMEQSSPQLSSQQHSSTTTSPSMYGFQYDEAFIRRSSSTNTQQLTHLEACLRTSRSSLAKDAIRKATIHLARHHYTKEGDSSEALHQLSVARSYCTTPWQQQEVILLMAEIGLGSSKSWYRVRDLHDPCQTAAGTSGASGGNAAVDAVDMSMENHALRNTKFSSKLNAAKGVANLASGRMEQASTCFLAISPSSSSSSSTGTSTTSSSTSTNNDVDFPQVLSPQDLALYSGLSILLAGDRGEIASLLQKNNTFSERLALKPNLRDAMHAYVMLNYGECLRLMEEERKEWEYDLYLAPQADELWRRVRGKCLVQYFEPYSAVSLSGVTDLFRFRDVEEAEDVVVDMIQRKEIVARIDGVAKTLSCAPVEELEKRKRRIMMRRLGRMGDGLLDDVERMLLRMACAEKNLLVGKSRLVGAGRKKRRDWGDAMMSKGGGGGQGNWGLEDHWALESSDEDVEGANMIESELENYMDTD